MAGTTAESAASTATVSDNFDFSIDTRTHNVASPRGITAAVGTSISPFLTIDNPEVPTLAKRSSVQMGEAKRVVSTAAQPIQPTQAYLAALRRPILIRTRKLLAGAVASSDIVERRGYIGAARDLVESLWQHTDGRDDHVSEYFVLLENGLQRKDGNPPSIGKLRALIAVVDSVLEKRLDVAARTEVRRYVLQQGAFELPSLSLEEALKLEDEEEHSEGYVEEE